MGPSRPQPVRFFMLERGDKITDLARRLPGDPYHSVRRAVNGEGSVPVDLAVRIADAMALPLETAFRAEDLREAVPA